MTADDLSAPLGQQQAKRRRRFPIAVPHVIAAALALFFGVFVIWAIVGDNPFGGEPMVAVPIGPDAAAASKKAEMTAPPGAAAATQGPGRYDGPAPGAAPGSPAPGQSGAGNTKTVTIIDGKTGARQEVVIPDSGNGGSPSRELCRQPEVRRDDAARPYPEDRRGRRAAGGSLRAASEAYSRQARRAAHCRSSSAVSA